MLYGAVPTDAVSLVGTTGVLAATALLASAIPARRVAGPDPAAPLRGD